MEKCLYPKLTGSWLEPMRHDPPLVEVSSDPEDEDSSSDSDTDSDSSSCASDDSGFFMG